MKKFEIVVIKCAAGDWWNVLCAEPDIGGSGCTLEEAMIAFSRSLESYLLIEEKFNQNKSYNL